MNRMQEQVADFHTALDLPARTVPTELSPSERHLRAQLMLEETVEVLAELGFELESEILVEVETRHDGAFLTSLAKELSDLLYVTFGTAVTAGLDIQPFFDAVHENNMTKTGGPVRPDGKRLKPPDYKPVNLSSVLRAQLEMGCKTCLTNAADYGPPHFASPYCESGRPTHCSCDTCF